MYRQYKQMTEPRGVPQEPDIFAAARLNSTEGLEDALKAGQTLQDTDDRDRNPLHVAAHYGSEDFVEAAAPMDRDALWMTDMTGRKPIDYAEMRGDVRPIEAIGAAMYPPGSHFEENPDGSTNLVVPEL